MATYGFPRRKFEVRAGNENKPAPLNWRRGLFRVWVVVSAAWFMGWTIYLIIFGLEGGFDRTGQVLALAGAAVRPAGRTHVVRGRGALGDARLRQRAETAGDLSNGTHDKSPDYRPGFLHLCAMRQF